MAQTISAGWAADPVHPNKHIYAKAALNLMEKMANSKPAATGGGPLQSRKRTWSASHDSGSSGSSGRSRGAAVATAAAAPAAAAATAAVEAGSPSAFSSGRKCGDGTIPDTRGMKDSSVTAGSTAAAAAVVQAAVMDLVSPSTLGSTAAETTTGTTTAAAAMTADTTRLRSRKGRAELRLFFKKPLPIRI